MGKNINFVIVFAILVASSAVVERGDAATYTVGDSVGWTIPTGGANFYTNWASQQVFRTGDVLVFNFSTGAHDVAKVAKAGYDGCSSNMPMSLITVGPANVTLDSTGESYFICTFGQHCSLGQKLAINVTGSPTPSPTPAPNVPPPAAPAPAPTPPVTPPGAPAPTPMITPPAPTPTPTGGMSPSPSPKSAPAPAPAPGGGGAGAPAPGAPAPGGGGAGAPAPGGGGGGGGASPPAPPGGLPPPPGSESPPSTPNSPATTAIATPFVVFASIVLGLAV